MMYSVMHDTQIKPEDYENTVYSFEYLKQSLHAKYLDMSKEAYLGKIAPNPKLLSLDGHSEKFLLDFENIGRPLVLNFGSCT